MSLLTTVSEFSKNHGLSIAGVGAGILGVSIWVTADRILDKVDAVQETADKIQGVIAEVPAAVAEVRDVGRDIKGQATILVETLPALGENSVRQQAWR